MSNRAHVESLLARVAEAAGLDSLNLDENDSVGLAYKEGVELVLTYDESEQTLVLLADVGVGPESGWQDLDRRLLEMNAAWRESGGVQFARDPRSGHVLIQRAAFVGGLDDAALASLLVDFAERATSWVQVVATFSVLAEPPAGSSADTLGHLHDRV